MVILLIEDEKKQSEFIQKALEQDYYKVDPVYDGQEALSRVEVRDYDLIIVDLQLPGLSGGEIVKKIRELKLKTPVLVLTANDDINSKVANLDNGADDYLTKPFALDELLARVRALLRREAQPLPQTFKQGNLELMYATHEVKIDGQPVKLTKNEFRLLDFLTRKPDRVCTRAMIEEHVWGYNTDNKSNVIEASIYNLRRKLGEKNKNIIQTVQNIGYRFKGAAS
jgi:two-component system, OmpR family, copper resistance phosphate regulon response regulator CusR